jgi:small-conductance mechanosensitive channel
MSPPPTKFERVSDALKIPAQPTRKLVHRPHFRTAILTGVGALLVLVLGSSLKGWHLHGPIHLIVVLGAPLAFLVLAISCVRAMAAELDDLARWRGGRSAGSTIRMVVTILGYLIATVAALGLTSYPVGHLLLGGAIIGVILGIAAQQSLGNVFAGLVLLAARPFAIGNHIRVRSGALGGEFYGTVLSMSLTYVTISTIEGILKVPNSSVLSSAVGPFRPPATPGAPAVPATPTTDNADRVHATR